MDSILSLTDVTKSYRTLFRATPALRGVSMGLAKGQCHVLLGPNGAGKSTLIGVALGFLRPDSGIVVLRGRDPDAYEARQRVGYLPEVFWPLSSSTPRTFLAHLRRLEAGSELTRDEISKEVDTLLREADLVDAADRRAVTLSKGMRQRLGILQAVMSRPEVLVLDEPNSGLDPVWRGWLREVIREHTSRGAAVLYCTHSLEEAAAIADETSIMVKGRIVRSMSGGVSAEALEIAFRTAMKEGVQA